MTDSHYLIFICKGFSLQNSENYFSQSSASTYCSAPIFLITVNFLNLFLIER